MIHKIIDNAIPEYVAGCLLDMMLESDRWLIRRRSGSEFNFKDYLTNPTTKIEKPQPSIFVLSDTGKITDHQLYGYCKSIFDYICYENGIVVKDLLRIIANANYETFDTLAYHTDNENDNYQSIVLMLTPNMTQTGFIVGDLLIPYEFCKAVWFDSKDLHTATPLVEDHALPRITIAFMFEV